MKASALILWKTEDKTRGGAIKVEAEGSTLSDTFDTLRRNMVEALDDAPNEQAFGWYQVTAYLDRN